jgi:manganese/iron transport system substrate-binding protein
MQELYLWPSTPDQQGTPQQVRAVIDGVKENDIPGRLLREHRLPGPGRAGRPETGAAYGGVLYVDSLSEADGPVPTYLDLLRVTSETIAAGSRSDLRPPGDGRGPSRRGRTRSLASMRAT